MSGLALGDTRPRLLLDAVDPSRLGPLLAGRPFRGTILVSQLSADAIDGLAVLGDACGQQDGVTLRVAADAHGDAVVGPRLAGRLPADWRVDPLTAGEDLIEGYAVRIRPLPGG